MYISLHVHDEEGSVGDSILKLKEYVAEGAKRKLPYLAVTNHGSMNSIYKFNHLCKEQNIEPIFGNEIYVTHLTTNQIDVLRSNKDKTKTHKIKIPIKDNLGNLYYHLVLLARNKKGFENLLKITSLSATQYFYSKPLTTKSLLKQYGEGIIALSGCVQGYIAKLCQAGYMELAKKEIAFYKSCFDAFYLEVQPGRFKEQIETNFCLSRISKETNTPLVITNDVHYLTHDQAMIHNIHLADHEGKIIQPNEPLIYPDDCYYFMKESEIKIVGLTEDEQEEAIKNTYHIARQIHVDLPQKVIMPVFSHDAQFDSKYKLAELAYSRLNQLFSVLSAPYDYSNRLRYELNIINQLGFTDYFLIIWDICRYAKAHGIALGPGRGSVCGSLLAYFLDITQVDPIRYNLMFERFLSEYRTDSIPDIDLDIDPDYRNELLSYVKQKYGADRCCLVSTKQMRKAKSAIRDAGRALNIDTKIIETIAELIPITYYDENGEKETDLSISNSLILVPELKNYEIVYPELFRYAKGLENVPKSESIHAAGVIIMTTPISDYLPMRRTDNPILDATALDLKDAENVAVKFDFLSLRTLSMIKRIQKSTGAYLDLTLEENLHDEAVWNTISSRFNGGLFQISSYTYLSRMPKIRPHTIEELAACLALIRGPCISSKLDVLYINICNGKSQIKLIHPIYDEATKETHGILIYQEQVMQVLINAGLSKEDSFRCMKYLTKKHLEKAQIYKNTFYESCKKQKIEKKTIDYIWNLIEESSKYSFNKSHAISYALLCYLTAYYKTYYPQSFFTELLTHEFIDRNATESKKKKTEKKYNRTFETSLEKAVKEAKAYHFKLHIPNINSCNEYCKIDGPDSIMLGACSIKGFGHSLPLFKGKGKLLSVEDIFKGCKKRNACRTLSEVKNYNKNFTVPDKRAVTVAIFAGLFDEVCGKDRFKTYTQYITCRYDYCFINKLETIDPDISINTIHFNAKDVNDHIEKILYGVTL